MVKFKIAVVLAFFFVGSVEGFAVSDSDTIKRLMEPRFSADRQQKNCTDFTGDWVGRCKSSDGHEWDSERDAYQMGCSALIYGANFYVIGSMVTESHADIDDVDGYGRSGYATQKKISWTKDFTVVYTEGTSNYYKQSEPHGETWQYTIAMAIVDDRLIYDYKSDTMTGVHCEYDRKGDL